MSQTFRSMPGPRFAADMTPEERERFAENYLRNVEENEAIARLSPEYARYEGVSGCGATLLLHSRQACLVHPLSTCV